MEKAGRIKKPTDKRTLSTVHMRDDGEMSPEEETKVSVNEILVDKQCVQ